MFAIFIDAVRAFVSAVTDARSLALSNLAFRHRLGVPGLAPMPPPPQLLSYSELIRR